MASANAARPVKSWGALEPLRERTFRRIWCASVVANFGQLILGVGAAWEMTRLATADMVALVQTALMLPLMLVSVPAGAIADMFDRRKIALAGLSFAVLCAAALTTLAVLGLTTPWVLLASCSMIGAGVALYSPAWGASISEQVEARHLPAAIALGSISYNLARSFGPAVGGVIVAAMGARAAFATNAVAYLPLLAAFFMWRRKHVVPRMPPERIDRAIISGTRYALHSTPIRTVLVRAFSFGTASAAASALVPLAARYILNGNASTYGLLLGCAGVGAVGGALLVSTVRERLKVEQAYALCAILGGRDDRRRRSQPQCAADRRVHGGRGRRQHARDCAAQRGRPVVGATLGRSPGARLVPSIAHRRGGHRRIHLGAGGCRLGCRAGIPCIGSGAHADAVARPDCADATVSFADFEMIDVGHEPEVALAITARSGPIVIEIDYRVTAAKARHFYNVMMKLQRVRLRNGAFDWSIARNIADPELWTERFHCPTWADYLRQRSRLTLSDRELQAAADAFDTGDRGGRVRRRLERPFGSVRWQAETPDPMGDSINIYTP